jgi:hypothetical protein
LLELSLALFVLGNLAGDTDGVTRLVTELVLDGDSVPNPANVTHFGRRPVLQLPAVSAAVDQLSVELLEPVAVVRMYRLREVVVQRRHLVGSTAEKLAVGSVSNDFVGVAVDLEHQRVRVFERELHSLLRAFERTLPYLPLGDVRCDTEDGTVVDVTELVGL